MDWVKCIIDACSDIWSYQLYLCGYSISLVNVFLFGFFSFLCFRIISHFM